MVLWLYRKSPDSLKIKVFKLKCHYLCNLQMVQLKIYMMKQIWQNIYYLVYTVGRYTAIYLYSSHFYLSEIFHSKL